jgi:hypothetical protein
VREEIQAASISYVSNPPSKMAKSLVLPSGTLELGADMALLTSDRELGGESLGLTDLGLLRPRARKSWNGWLETFVATQLLVKQPNRADEPIWQGATAGALFAFEEHFGFELAGSGGPMLGDAGFWIGAEPRLLAKAIMEYDVRFQVGVGYAFSVFDYAADAMPDFALHEAVLHAEAQLGSNRGSFWVRMDYRLPFASAVADTFEPTPQINLQLGGVLSAGRNTAWNVFAYVAVIDRGELSDPATTLPILDGGFDQQQWVIGVQHRFGAEPPPPR